MRISKMSPKPKSRKVSSRLQKRTKPSAKKISAKATSLVAGKRSSPKRRPKPSILSASKTSRSPVAARATSRRKRQPKPLLVMIKKNILKSAHDLGDSAEKAGKRLRREGRVRTGKIIERVGNRLEHV